MGVTCEFCVIEPPDSDFTPGSLVCGNVKYAFDTDTDIRNITLSLEGHGRLYIIQNLGFSYSENGCSDCNAEDYVCHQDILHNDDEGTTFLTGEYENEFSFILPEKIPSSFYYYKCNSNCEVLCEIKYFVRIRFDMQDPLQLETSFKKEIKVSSTITRRLPMKPHIYGQKKTFFQLFRRKKNFIKLKACIKNSVIEPGHKVVIGYEITNESNTTVQAIKTKLIEIYTFNTNEFDTIKFYSDVKGTDSKTSMIQCGETKEFSLDINTPSSMHSMEYSKMVSRNYAVLIVACLPIPYKNVLLEIPVQIGKYSETHFNPNTPYGGPEHIESPPSYWQSTLNNGQQEYIKRKMFHCEVSDGTSRNL